MIVSTAASPAAGDRGRRPAQRREGEHDREAARYADRVGVAGPSHITSAGPASSHRPASTAGEREDQRHAQS
jgi:hypothetical protein